MCPSLRLQRLRLSSNGSRFVRENSTPAASKDQTPGFSRRQSSFSSRRYQSCFQFGDRGHLLQHEAACWPLYRRKIREAHVHPRIEQPLKKSHGAGEAVYLRNDERRAMHPTERERLLQRRSVIPFSAFELNELCDDLTASVTRVTRNRSLLRFEAES